MRAIFFKVFIICSFIAISGDAQVVDHSDNNYDSCKAQVRGWYIILRGFKRSDISEAKVYIYKSITDYEACVDSTHCDAEISLLNNFDSTFGINVPAISTDRNFVLVFNDGSTYRISDIILAKFRRPWHHKHHEVCDIASLKVNGVEYYDRNIILTKK